MDIKRISIQAGLAVVAIVLGILIVKGVMKPIDFKQEKNARYDKVVNDLKDFREIQLAFQSKYGRFCGHGDSLITFLKNDSLEMVKKIGDMEDSAAVADGRAYRDTIMVSVFENLKHEEKLTENFNADSLLFIPFSGGEQYKIGAGTFVTGSRVQVPVFEVSATNWQILKGLDEQLIINLNDRMAGSEVAQNKFAGLKVGDLKAANNNAGNWE